MIENKFVLVVEDDVAVNKALISICRMRGWQTRSALTVAAAMTHLNPPPACIILDLMLPDGNGHQVLQAVRKQNSNTKVIVTTGSHDSEMLEKVNALHPDCFMPKPVNGEALVAKIHSYMEG